MKVIEIIRFIKVDDEDFEELGRYVWFINPAGYVCALHEKRRDLSVMALQVL